MLQNNNNLDGIIDDESITKKRAKPQIIVAQTTKSNGISFLLILLFGPLGLFYATITGGVIMTFLFPPGLVMIFFPVIS